MNPALLTLIALACSGTETTPAADAPVAVSPAEPAGTAAEATAAETTAAEATAPAAAGAPWSPRTIGQLDPVLPTHSAPVPVPVGATPEVEAALATLGTVVDTYGLDPDQPWALGHALVARGADARLPDGTLAFEALVEGWAVPLSLDDGPTLLEFPKETTRDGHTVRVEPHSDLMLKALTEIGVAPEHVVTVSGQDHPLADLWRGSVVRSYLVPATNHSRYGSPDDVPWSLQALATWAPADLAWTAIDGTPMTLDALTEFGTAVLFQETRFLAESQRSGQPFVRKGQGVFQYTCGGAHLLQGVAFAVLRGFGSERARTVIEEQVALQFHRYPIEMALYDKAVGAMPEHTRILTIQKLKFSGHFLESMSKLSAMGIYRPDEAQQQLLAQAAQDVAATTRALETQGAFSELSAMEQSDLQQYLDIIGDSAHAVRGLELALGRAEVRW